MVPATITRSCQTDREPRMNLAGRGCAGLLQELQQQVTNFLGLLLLHPVAGAVDQMTAEHARAGACLHRFKDAGALISAQSCLPEMKQEGTSILRPEYVSSSALNAPEVPQRYHCSPPWNPVRAYSAL